MVEPQNQKQSQYQEPIYPEIKRSNFIGVPNYNDAYKLSKRFKDSYV